MSDDSDRDIEESRPNPDSHERASRQPQQSDRPHRQSGPQQQNPPNERPPSHSQQPPSRQPQPQHGQQGNQPRQERPPHSQPNQSQQPPRQHSQGQQPQDATRNRRGTQPRGQQPHGQPQQPSGGQRPPRQQQGRQPTQGRPPQGQPPQGQPPQGPGGTPPGDDSDDGGFTDDISRRQLLAGGAGVVALGGVGSWWAFLRGPSGAKGVVDEYYSAVNDADVDAMMGLYHENTVMYERATEATDAEEFFGEYIGDIEFSVEGLYEMTQYSDPEERGIDPTENDVSEVIEIMSIIEVDESALSHDERRHEDEDVYKDTQYFTTVLTADDDWKLWD